MNVLGIIAEYNPFHSGHAFQLQTCKRCADADYTLVVLGSDFNQRGTPAIINKYTRTMMALKGGADAVIEMPQFASCASAAYFAASGVGLLAHSGICTHLGFGSESGDLDMLQHYSDYIVDETPEMSHRIQSRIKEGMTFAAARNAVISSMINNSVEHPNDILAVEYLNALKQYSSSIVPVTIKRRGQSYHAADTGHSFLSETEIHTKHSASSVSAYRGNTSCLSATAIRKLTESMTDSHDTSLEYLQRQLMDAIPTEPLQIYINHLTHTGPVTASDFYPLLRYSLLSCPSLTDVFDISPDYANRLQSFIGKYDHLDAWVSAIKSKNYTWTKVSRSLTHILLHQTRSDDTLLKSMDYAPYIRILGFKKSAAPLLKQLKIHCDLPIITKMADASSVLNADQRILFEKSVYAERIYKSVEQTKTSGSIKDVYQESPVIVNDL